MDCRDLLKTRLKNLKKGDIVLSRHAKEQAIFRQIKLSEIRENIINPVRLYHAKEQPAKIAGERKFDCYFDYHERLCHRYILVNSHRCIVCTVIKINRRWRHLI